MFNLIAMNRASTYIGTAAVIGSLISKDLAVLFSPLAFAVGVYGCTDTAILHTDAPFAPSAIASYIGHILIMIACLSRKRVTRQGVAFAAVVLGAVLGAYRLLDTWPYTLTPLQSVVFVASMLVGLVFLAR